MKRKKSVRRRTKETKVEVRIGLDGTGACKLSVPDRWLRHMLESAARFGKFDLEIRAGGDFCHHVVEDVGLTLGRAFREALRGRPVERTGTGTVPMDEALVTASVDLVDRPFFKAGLPDKMLEHFLRSFAMEARITLHVVILRGEDFHHINEAAFKALGMALHQATRPARELRSTKGRVRWKR